MLFSLLKNFSENSPLKRIYKLEAQLSQLKKDHEQLKLEFYQKEFIRKSQILRVRNQEELSNDFLIKDLTYLDLSPEKSFRLYQEIDLDFILLDVSQQSFGPETQIIESVKIPLEELIEQIHKINGFGKTIFVISEKGIRSIIACKLLAELGFCNLNNISGGHKFWPGHRGKKTVTLADNFTSDDDFLKEA